MFVSFPLPIAAAGKIIGAVSRMPSRFLKPAPMASPAYELNRFHAAARDSAIAGAAARSGMFGVEGIAELSDANALQRTHNISGRASSRNVAAIANDMKFNGYNGPPIDVVKDKSGTMYIIDGHHRAFAARMTSTQVKVNVVTDIAGHPSSYKSLEEIIHDSLLVERDNLRLKR